MGAAMSKEAKAMDEQRKEPTRSAGVLDDIALLLCCFAGGTFGGWLTIAADAWLSTWL